MYVYIYIYIYIYVEALQSGQWRSTQQDTPSHRKKSSPIWFWIFLVLYEASEPQAKQQVKGI